MLGYKLRASALDYCSFAQYNRSSVVPFVLKKLAQYCGYRVWLNPSTGGGYIDVAFTDAVFPLHRDNLLVPWILVPVDSFIGDLEVIGYADTASQYLDFAFKSVVGTLSHCCTEKMFENATLEQLLIDIDIEFEGDKRELMPILPYA